MAAVPTVSDASAIQPPARDDAPASRDEYGSLGPVFRLGHRIAPVGLVIGFAIGLSTHGIASARALALGDLRHWWRDARDDMSAFYFTTYDVDIDEPKQEEKAKEPDAIKEPEPEKEKEPDPLAPPPPPKPEEDPYKDAPPPKPAEAAQVVTAPENGQQPLDGFDTQSGKDPKGALDGKTANNGEGKDPVRDPRASTSGSPKGNGDKPGATGNKTSGGADLSRPPTLVGSTSWSCPFPAEADAEGRDSATATIVVTVRADGSPQSVSVVADPGAGFGRAARQCALGRRYQPALDRGGSPTTGTTPPIRVRFSR